MFRIFPLLLLFAAVAPTHADALVTRDGRPVRNVAIISRLGDHAVVFHAVTSVPIGTFRPDTRTVLIPDFGIDERIEQAVAVAVAPLTVVSLAPDARAAFGTCDRRTAGDMVRKLPPRDDIDAYIAICPDESYDEVGKTMLTIRGYGLYHRWRLITYTTAVFAVYRVMVIDARTGETIVGRESGIESGFLESSIPKMDVERSRWPGDSLELTPDQVLLLRDDLTRLIDESLAWTLSRMKLKGN